MKYTLTFAQLAEVYQAAKDRLALQPRLNDFYVAKNYDRLDVLAFGLGAEVACACLLNGRCNIHYHDGGDGYKGDVMLRNLSIGVKCRHYGQPHYYISS